MPKVFTIQVGKWRLAKDRDIKVMDTTVKSGYSIFAPTWDMVLGIKNGSMDEDTYSQLYRDMLVQSWKGNRQKWMDFLNDDDQYALACYCKAGVFCHRHLLVKFLQQLCKQLNIPFEYYGELTNDPQLENPHPVTQLVLPSSGGERTDTSGSTDQPAAGSSSADPGQRDGDPGSS
ncbi:hypothetical protein [Xanthomonas phage RTH11]|nr:hypothetical protein [Xanthomonas phage RTH11]